MIHTVKQHYESCRWNVTVEVMYHLFFLPALLIKPLLLLKGQALLLLPVILQHLLVEGARRWNIVFREEALHKVRQLIDHHLQQESAERWRKIGLIKLIYSMSPFQNLTES